MIERIYQTLETVFYPISKHFGFRPKQFATCRIFNSLFHVWKSDETLIARVRYIDFYAFISPFILPKKKYQTRDTLSSDFQTLRTALKILRYESYFQLSSRGLEIG